MAGDATGKARRQSEGPNADGTTRTTAIRCGADEAHAFPRMGPGLASGVLKLRVRAKRLRLRTGKRSARRSGRRSPGPGFPQLRQVGALDRMLSSRGSETMIVRTLIKTGFCIALASAALPALAQPALTLNVEPAGSGWVASFPNSADIVAGVEVTVTATPEPGFQFVGWTGDVESEHSSMSFELNDNTQLTAVFQEISFPEGTELHQLTAFVEPSGAGSIVREPALFDYADGQQVTLNAYAGQGFVFAGWSGDLPEGADPMDATLVLTMNDSLDVRANFSAGLVLDEDDAAAGCGAVGIVPMGALMLLMLALRLGNLKG